MGWKAILSLFPVARYGSPSDPHAQPTVYVFRDWQGAVACAAPGDQVFRAFGDLAGLSSYFGGYMTFGRLFSSNEFVGVWGNRNASRFRRILRDSLGDLTVVHAKPPARLSGRSVSNTRPTAVERRAYEHQLKERWNASHSCL